MSADKGKESGQLEDAKRVFHPIRTKEDFEIFESKHNYHWHRLCYAISENPIFLIECYRSMRAFQLVIPEWVLEYFDTAARGIVRASSKPEDLREALQLDSMADLGRKREATSRWANRYMTFVSMTEDDGVSMSEAYRHIAEADDLDVDGVRKKLTEIRKKLDGLEKGG